MAAQPLAWFEGAGLPAETIAVGAPVIKKYREIQADLHKGSISPLAMSLQEEAGQAFSPFRIGKGISSFSGKPITMRSTK